MKVIQNVRYYLLFDIINKAIPFLLLPVLTIYLAPESYGSLSLFTVFQAFLSPFIHLVLSANIHRTYFKQGKEATAKLIFNLQLVTIVACLLVAIVIFIFKNPLADYLSLSSTVLLFIPFVILLGANIEYFLIIARNEEQVTGFGIFQIVYTSINLGLSLIFVILLNMDWYGRVYGSLISLALMGGFSIVYLAKQGLIKAELDFQLIKNCLWISLPLIPNGLANNIINLSDRFFIEELINKEALGIYSVGYALGMIVHFAVTALNNAINPWIYQQLQTATDQNIAQRKIKLVRFTWLYAAMLICLVIGITLGGNLLIYLGFLPPSYQAASVYIFWVAASYACFGMMLILFPYVANTGKTNYYFPLSISVALINLVGNYWLIQWAGAIGATYATLISYVVLFAGTWVYAQKVYPMPWLSAKVFKCKLSDIQTLFDED